MTGSNYTLVEPKGIDFAIQRLQNFLFSNIEWSNVQLNGRVDKVPNGETKSGFKPYAYFTENDYKNVERDDNYNANIFFVPSDSTTSSDGIMFRNELTIVFMLDLKKLYPDYVGRASELAHKQAVQALQNQTAFTITSVGTGVDEALGDFDREDVKFTDMHPNHVFCITGNLSFLISC